MEESFISSLPFISSYLVAIVIFYFYICIRTPNIITVTLRSQFFSFYPHIYPFCVLIPYHISHFSLESFSFNMRTSLVLFVISSSTNNLIFPQSIFILPSFLEDIFTGYKIMGFTGFEIWGFFFSFQHLKDVIPLSSIFHNFWWKVKYTSNFSFWKEYVVFLLLLSGVFTLTLKAWQQLPRCGVLCLLIGGLLSFLNLWPYSLISFGNFLTITSSNIPGSS